MKPLAPIVNIVADQRQFAEGPVVLPDGRVAFVELGARAVSIYDGSRVSCLATLSGRPNGLAAGADGALYVANNGGLIPWNYERWTLDEDGDGAINRVTASGEVSDYVVDLPGERPHRPNDLCFGPQSRLYFTDSGNWERMLEGNGQSAASDGYRGGALMVRQTDGVVHRLADVPAFPNGITVTPDGSSLLVSQTLASRVLAFPLRADGSVGDPDVYVTLPEPFNPDGLCFADDGTLFVAGTAGAGVVVVGPNRRVDGFLSTGPNSLTTNVALAPGRLWVTTGFEEGSLGYFDVPYQPMPLYT